MRGDDAPPSRHPLEPPTASASDGRTEASSPLSVEGSSFPSADDKAFMGWLADRGGTFSGKGVYSAVEGILGVGDRQETGRGVFAKEDAANGDEVFTIPIEAALVVPSKAAGPMVNRLASVNPEWGLAVMLVRETAEGEAASASRIGSRGRLVPRVPRRVFCSVLFQPCTRRCEDVALDRLVCVCVSRRYAAGRSSPYAPFLRVLERYPPPGATLPRLSLAATRALEGTYAAHYAEAFEVAAAEGWTAVHRALVSRFPTAFPPERYTEKTFRAALAVVHAVGSRLPGGAALVPVAHLLPHDPRGAAPCAAAVYDVDANRDAIVVRTAARSRGEELGCNRGAAVAIPAAGGGEGGGDAGAREAGERRSAHGLRAGPVSVGHMSDAEAMARFGTVGPGHNPANRLRLSLPPAAEEVGTSPTAAAARDDLMAACGDEEARAMTSDGPTPELMCAVRAATADDSEVVVLRDRLTDKEKNAGAVHMLGGPKAVSEASEARALAALHETVAALLDAYPTSDAEDEAALLVGAERAEDDGSQEDGGSPPATPAPLEGDAREAVRCRLREKLLLVNALNGLQRAAAVRLKERAFDLDARTPRSGGGSDTDHRPPPKEGAVSPPDGFEARKTHYRGGAAASRGEGGDERGEL